VVQNMPGAGGLRGANYLYNVAARDGTAFGVTTSRRLASSMLRIRRQPANAASSRQNDNDKSLSGSVRR
jgi:tripartite-type tricarboxylate transporter receptor subunit TctC